MKALALALLVIGIFLLWRRSKTAASADVATARQNALNNPWPSYLGNTTAVRAVPNIIIDPRTGEPLDWNALLSR